MELTFKFGNYLWVGNLPLDYVFSFAWRIIIPSNMESIFKYGSCLKIWNWHLNMASNQIMEPFKVAFTFNIWNLPLNMELSFKYRIVI